jgi:energy-coupling factor transporter ATP-binding protein EcfA2
MTLRGIGSYFHGAELQLRPLTILCGKNGSGKSTWLKIIEVLQRSSQKGKLPFAFDVDDTDCHDMQLANALLSNASLHELDKDPHSDARFGPLGTIGVRMSAIASGSLFDPPVTELPLASNHAAAKLLWTGSLEEGAQLRLRIAHASDGMCEYHQDFVEIVFADKYVIRMERPMNIGTAREPNKAPYVLQCSRAFFTADDGAEVVPVLRFKAPGPGGSPWEIDPLGALPDRAVCEAFVTRCIELSRAILEPILEGIFRITAIRDQQVISSLDDSPLTTIAELIDQLGTPLKGRKPNGYTSEELIQMVRDRMNKLVADERIAARYVGPHGESALSLWRSFSNTPSFAEEVSRHLKALLTVAVSDPPEIEETDLWRFTNPCLCQSQGPAQLSSGFHQLMPIIVQAAVMRRGEILAIDNPEVHLHPSLQLDIAKFLIDQAIDGKTIIVETHSDLFIRRVIRAVLREELPQHALNIQFVSLRNGGKERRQSSISEPLTIGEDGRIRNWPQGFLDDDIKESRRLFEVMYGAIPEDDSETMA